jgi:hypothetical protein
VRRRAAVPLGVLAPQALGLDPQAIQWPGRVDASFVIGNDLGPGLGGIHLPVATAPDPVADDAAQHLEAGDAVDPALAHGVAEDIVDRRARCARVVEVELGAARLFERRHGHHRLGKLGEVVVELPARRDAHQTRLTALQVD